MTAVPSGAKVTFVAPDLIGPVRLRLASLVPGAHCDHMLARRQPRKAVAAPGLVLERTVSDGRCRTGAAKAGRISAVASQTNTRPSSNNEQNSHCGQSKPEKWRDYFSIRLQYGLNAMPA